MYQLIQDIFFEGHVSFNDEIYLTNMRHKTEVSEALKSLAMAVSYTHLDVYKRQPV